MNAEFESWYGTQFPSAASVKNIFDQHEGEYVNASVFFEYERWVISCKSNFTNGELNVCQQNNMRELVIYGDGIHDDSAALQAIFDGRDNIILSDGAPYYRGWISGRTFMISKQLILGGPRRSNTIKRDILSPPAFVTFY